MMRFAIAAIVAVTLPGDVTLFRDRPGAPADAVNSNCLACHSAEMILYQPHLSRVEWQGEITKMRTAYKAPVDPADDAAILDWLVAMQAERTGPASRHAG